MSPENLQVLFDTHPTVDEFFITSDDQAFFSQEMADSHGQRLKERKVVSAKRDDAISDAFEAGSLDPNKIEFDKAVNKAATAKAAAAVPALEKAIAAAAAPVTEKVAAATSAVATPTVEVANNEGGAK